MIPAIGYIVEGEGEVEAVRCLVERIVGEMDSPIYPLIPRPVRVSASKLLKTDDIELERSIELALGNAREMLSGRGLPDRSAVHILIDREQDRREDCPAVLGPELLRRARLLRSDVPIAVSLAIQEYEAWFLAAAESLAGRHGLPAGIGPPADPEAIRDAKGWLGERMGRKYIEKVHQPAFTSQFSLQLARERSPSFDKFYRDTIRLLTGSSAP